MSRSQEAVDLFKEVQRVFSLTTLGDDRWYFIPPPHLSLMMTMMRRNATIYYPTWRSICFFVYHRMHGECRLIEITAGGGGKTERKKQGIAALSGAGEPEYVVQLYSHLIEQPEYATPESRPRLVRRLREALVKCVPIIGVCRPLEAILGIAKVEKEEDKDYSFSREHWQSGEQNHERGMSWLSRIYQSNLDGIQHSLAAHRDFCTLTPPQHSPYHVLGTDVNG
ncbi:conserved hypothetical protein [Microsporum canis CBS 113480]|uniref:Uncharacterized protein n=1 Tax=Arthroderma otae (strain ATCC MYA-4605 / CBS 113480) TaxID=554155 RepID=C5FW08_ARTOC|nr:conserved hypothetical protein [Microsporum canis CBS 113480]EEQ34092.1 conserved hypothetical protein [Microsporum canis CBS 113480]